MRPIGSLLGPFILALFLLFDGVCIAAIGDSSKDSRPNILVCVADDWSWPYAGAYGRSKVKTPTFDRLSEEGVLFEQAYVTSPSCTPSRSSILTGQYHWRLGPGANLWGQLNKEFPVYPLLLENAGYHVGHTRKCWGPGDLSAGGYDSIHPGGMNYEAGFGAFLDSLEDGDPFCFWFGTDDPHRPYREGSGKTSGMDLDSIRIPAFFPDSKRVRSDIADYCYEIERFDRQIGSAVALLEERGELENTIIVITGDNGMPFPRCKSNLYDAGVRVPLVIYWGNKIKGDRRITDFVSLSDLAPTFLDACGVEIPKEMSGRSLLKNLRSRKKGRVDKSRNHVVFGKERHSPAQLAPSIVGYPSRGIRTDQYLYIVNFEPDRWPAGVPKGGTLSSSFFADCDNGPTKTYLIQKGPKPEVKPFFDLCFAKRPAEELYDVINDPDQVNNLAEDPEFDGIKNGLSQKLISILIGSGDPRALGNGKVFDEYPFRTTSN